MGEIMQTPLIVPGAEPFFLPGGPIGCLLLHGFTSMPEEMRWLGDDLAQRGHTVLGIRLAGHATRPQDLARTRWTDWLVSVEEGLSILSGVAEQVFILGLSMGGNVALLAAAHYPMAGTVAMSTPYPGFSRRSVALLRLSQWIRPVLRKGGVEPHPTLGPRREAGYPAYAELPTRILLELAGLQAEMRDALGSVRVPVLLIHSRDDAAVLPESMPQIYQALGTEDKEMLWLEGFDHAVVRDPKRAEAFVAIAAFLERVAGSG
jgi:carboxylesterase